MIKRISFPKESQPRGTSAAPSERIERSASNHSRRLSEMSATLDFDVIPIFLNAAAKQITS